MTDQIIADRIVVSPDVVHGKPHIAGTRTMVYQVLDILAAGKAIAEITSEDYFPDLTEADVRACLNYASRIIRTP